MVWPVAVAGLGSAWSVSVCRVGSVQCVQVCRSGLDWGGRVGNRIVAVVGRGSALFGTSRGVWWVVACRAGLGWSGLGWHVAAGRKGGGSACHAGVDWCGLVRPVALGRVASVGNVAVDRVGPACRVGQGRSGVASHAGSGVLSKAVTLNLPDPCERFAPRPSSCARANNWRSSFSPRCRVSAACVFKIHTSNSSVDPAPM